MGKQIFLLNGPSSSGKSTLAKELQMLISEKRNEKFDIVSIDDFLKMNTEDTIYEDDVFEISGDLCKKVIELLKTGSGAIIDHVITSERIFNQLKEMLSTYPIKFVHITCPLDVLREREKERKNRSLGSAEASYEYLYPKEGYDLTLDTDSMSAKDCALKIYEKFLR